MASLEMNNVSIVNHNVKGRGLHATKTFSENEIVFEEDPLVSCQFAWNQDLGYSACDHCLRPLETPEQNARRLCQVKDLELPNSDIAIPELNDVKETFCECLVKYCSSDCQAIAYQRYHRALCFVPGSEEANALQTLKEVWKKMHYPPESATVMILIRIYALIHQAEDKAAIIQKFQEFVSDSNNPAICEKLLGSFYNKVNFLRESVVKCIESLHLAIPPEVVSPAGFFTSLSILALNGQGIGTSSFSYWVKEVRKDDSSKLESFIDSLYLRMEEAVGLEFLDNEGSGLYILQSKINHSCEPNAEVTFPLGSHNIAIRCLRDIADGEEINISYLDECDLNRSRHSRQKELRERYHFLCICPKCEKQCNDPDETSEDEDSDEEMED